MGPLVLLVPVAEQGLREAQAGKELQGPLESQEDQVVLEPLEPLV